MIDDVTQARRTLEIAQVTSERMWAEHTAHCRTLDPALGLAGAEEMRRLRAAFEWQGKVYAAEHALFKAEHGTPGVVGSHGEYQWLTMVDRDITSLLMICPEIVLGKYPAVTSIDWGPLRLTEQEKGEGWWTAEAGKVFQGTSWSPPEYEDDWRVAYSPQIPPIHGLPNETHDECAGFDEWYAFEQQVPVEEIESFVNWGGFRLYDPKFEWCAGSTLESACTDQPRVIHCRWHCFHRYNAEPRLVQSYYFGLPRIRERLKGSFGLLLG